jgi:hypothetical protein
VPSALIVKEHELAGCQMSSLTSRVQFELGNRPYKSQICDL